MLFSFKYFAYNLIVFPKCLLKSTLLSFQDVSRSNYTHKQNYIDDTIKITNQTNLNRTKLYPYEQK